MSNIIIGRNAIIEAFGAGTDIEKVYVLNSVRGEFEVQIRQLCKEHNVPLAKVPEPKLNDLSKSRNHQGVVALTSPISYVEYTDVIAQAFDAGRQPLLVVLDSITDVRNIGAIARSSYYFGVDGIIISGNFKGQINEDTIKASAGAIANMPISRANSLFNLMADLQSMGIQVVATSLTSNAILPHESDLTMPTAILLGSEDRGIHPKALDVVDIVVKIPSSSDFDSLNVSVAAGIVLYECFHQRNR
jgi:23S rRNA (guanosine2251-2'-O)-methyltransferase